MLSGHAMPWPTHTGMLVKPCDHSLPKSIFTTEGRRGLYGGREAEYHPMRQMATTNFRCFTHRIDRPFSLQATPLRVAQLPTEAAEFACVGRLCGRGLSAWSTTAGVQTLDTGRDLRHRGSPKWHTKVSRIHIPERE